MGRLRTKSHSLNLLAITLVLYLLAALCFDTNSLKWALSLSSCIKSRLSSNAPEFSSSVRVSLHQLGGLISAGIIASVPYTMVKGASPVEDWGVVWYDHKIGKRWATHPSPLLVILLLIALKITLLADSACPLAWGCSTEMKVFCIPFPLQNWTTFSLANWVPLSDTMYLGSLNLQMIFLQ
ncbi:hypothetical protein QL285_083964 [Trifolium repens]|nr:hypothetical protein QL285_083964 [Trifolium repens]